MATFKNISILAHLEKLLFFQTYGELQVSKTWKNGINKKQSSDTI